MRLELQDAHKDYVENKARRDEAMRLEEEEYRRQMMEKFAEDDRIEQMNAQRRRMKQLGPCRGVIVLITVDVMYGLQRICNAWTTEAVVN